MTNPATTLLGLFEKWNGDSNDSPYNIRGFSKDPDTCYTDHDVAIKAIADISRSLDYLESQGQKVGAYRRAIKLFIAALLSVPAGWAQGGAQVSTMTVHMFDMLEALESVLAGNVVALNPNGAERIGDLLNQVIAGLDDDPNLSAQLKAHILRVVQTVRDCIEEFGLTGETNLREALHNLWISLYAAAGATSDEQRGFWQNLATNVGFPAAGSALGSLPGIVTSLMLTQG